ncbi:MAG: sodium:solute symporter family transporter [Beijerinckiaceae bacterium]
MSANIEAKIFFFVFILLTLVITYWAARRTKTTEHFYAAGHGVTGFQNGLALAGDYMSAASFLGIAGLVALNGFDGLIYSTGWLVGWPIILFLIAEPLRNLGKYTFTDVVAYRLQQTPVRIAAVFGTMAVVLTYLIAQMVGAGTLIKLLFNLDYQFAIIIVGCVMMAYVLFGGMIATTWVQIIKAGLLLGGAVVMAVLVLAQFGFNPATLFAKAAELNGAKVLEPGTKVVTGSWDAISLGFALMFGTAGLPHILMRFYTVPDAKQARKSVLWATIWIGVFYLITFILGFGAMVLVGIKQIVDVGGGGNMAAPLLANAVGGPAFFGFICAVAFATILAVVAGLTLSGAAALSHDIWVSVVKGGHASEKEQLLVARIAALILGVCAILLGIVFQGQNVAYMVGLTFSIAASANFPALMLAIFWRRLTTWGAVAAIVVGTGSALILLYCGPTVQIDVLKHSYAEVSQQWWYFPLKNPGLVSMLLSFGAGILVSLVKREPAAEAGFVEVERRAILGPLAVLAETKPAPAE